MLGNRDFGEYNRCSPKRPIRQNGSIGQENEFNTIDGQCAHADVGGDVNNVLIIEEGAVVGIIVNVQVGNAALNVAANVAVDNDVDQDNKIEKDLDVEIGYDD